METAIRVAVRIRPLSEQELCQPLGGDYILRAVDGHVVAFDPPPESTVHVSGLRVAAKATQRRHKDLKYAFDVVLDEHCSQQEAYELSTKGLIDSVLDGFNATVFAYGVSPIAFRPGS
jgi:kinesin family protein 18/19